MCGGRLPLSSHVQVQRLEKEKTAKINDLLSVLGCGAIGSPVNDKEDYLFLMKCSQQLKEWTGKTYSTVLYDSKVDPFTHDGVFAKVRGKPNCALIGVSTDGDVFGAFYSVAVTKQEEWLYDPSVFAFSFESHGRCKTPQRFPVKESAKSKVFISFMKSFSDGFFWVGVSSNIGFNMGNAQSTGTCDGLSDMFEGIKDTTLTGKENTHYTPLRFSRLVAVQLNE